ncbi:MAG: transposase [Bryobacterales bacterium]|nr:transposase [Bryobacterales bacterium]
MAKFAQQSKTSKWYGKKSPGCTRRKKFLPRGLEQFQRRAEDVAILIREVFLRGTSMRQVGRIVATCTGEPVSAQTVSKKVRKRDYDQVKADSQRIYLADSQRQARTAFQRFQTHGREPYPALVKQLEAEI